MCQTWTEMPSLASSTPSQNCSRSALSSSFLRSKDHDLELWTSFLLGYAPPPATDDASRGCAQCSLSGQACPAFIFPHWSIICRALLVGKIALKLSLACRAAGWLHIPVPGGGLVAARRNDECKAQPKGFQRGRTERMGDERFTGDRE